MSNSNLVPLPTTATTSGTASGVSAAFLALPTEGLDQEISSVALAKQFDVPHARVLHEIYRFSMWDQFSRYFVADTYLSHGREYPCFMVGSAVMLPLTFQLPGDRARAWRMRCMNKICAVHAAVGFGTASKLDRRTAWEILEIDILCSAARSTIKKCRKAGKLKC